MFFKWLRKKRLRTEPTRFVGYGLLKLLHEGQKSLVYQARAAATDQVCAIKVYNRSFDRTARRLRKKYNLRSEGEIGKLLNPPPGHPLKPHHIVITLDYGKEFGREDGSHYIVMEYVDGHNLKNLICMDHPMMRRNRLEIARQICDGLLYIHSKGLIHRDFCSDNVLFRKDRVVKLIDLGFVAPMGLRFEERTGTPTYMSPEQARGETLDARSDIYSLGVVLFELFTGHVPFGSELSQERPELASRRATEIMQQHIHQEPPRPRRFASGISDRIETLILRCLEKAPAKRFQNVRDVLMLLSEESGTC